MLIEEFVRINIEKINKKISDFKSNKKLEYNDTDIKKYLKNKLFLELSNTDLREQLLKEFSLVSFKKNKIIDIANTHIFYKTDLERFYENIIFSDIQDKIAIAGQSLTKKVVELLSQDLEIEKERFSYIKNDLIKIMDKSLFITSMNGFFTNIVNVESGVMTANAGDSAQFLFLSRAILAGYNASNVDVRSSRYDAVIDHDGVILKVQVKGISSTTVSFKDRDRGGQGIDHTHERNKGKRITSKDCDIYAAVDKQAGICYLVPMNEIDKLPDEKIKAVNIKEINMYKENWKIIDTLCKVKK